MIDSKRWIDLIKKNTFATILVVFVVLGFVSGIWAWSYSTRSRQQTVEVKITSKAGAIRVEKSERTMVGTTGVIAIRLKNVSQKDIHAYTISNGSSWVNRNYFLTEQSFAPGTTEDHLIPFSEDDSELVKQFTKSGGEFSVVAAIFDDGTTDGDQQFGAMLANQRAGVREQIGKILPLVRNLSLSAPKRDQTLADLKTKIQSLPDKGDESSPPDYQVGLSRAKEEMLKQVSAIQDELRGNQPDAANARHQKLMKTLKKLNP